MQDCSVFMDKRVVPTLDALKVEIDKSYVFWKEIEGFVLEKYPDAKMEWNYPGKKYGWSYRLKDKRRAILYFLPRKNYFKVAFVFGQKATDLILASSLSEIIKEELSQATKYAEGRGFGISIEGDNLISDIKRLVEIKLAH